MDFIRSFLFIFKRNEIEDDYEKESPEYGSPEKKIEEDDEIPEIIEKISEFDL